VRDEGGADHVPDVLVRAARNAFGRLREDFPHEGRKLPRPVAGPVLPRVLAEAFDEAGFAAVGAAVGATVMATSLLFRCTRMKIIA
jgi:hypothetical protein